MPKTFMNDKCSEHKELRRIYILLESRIIFSGILKNFKERSPAHGHQSHLFLFI